MGSGDCWQCQLYPDQQQSLPPASLLSQTTHPGDKRFEAEQVTRRGAGCYLRGLCHKFLEVATTTIIESSRIFLFLLIIVIFRAPVTVFQLSFFFPNQSLVSFQTSSHLIFTVWLQEGTITFCISYMQKLRLDKGSLPRSLGLGPSSVTMPLLLTPAISRGSEVLCNSHTLSPLG